MIKPPSIKSMLILFALALLPSAAQGFVQDTVTNRYQMQAELERGLREIDANVNSRVDSELKDHRQYLQDLNDRFYDRLSFWLPIGTAIGGIIFAVFLWQVGKTQKEAYEAAQLVAVAKATELAQEKVKQIVIPDAIIAQIRGLTEESALEIRNLRTELVQQVRDELTAARDEVVRDKQTMILESIDNAIATEFKQQFDVMGRLQEIEKRVGAAEKRLAATSQALSASLRLLESELKTTRRRSSIANVFSPYIPFSLVLAESVETLMTNRLSKQLESLEKKQRDPADANGGASGEAG